MKTRFRFKLKRNILAALVPSSLCFSLATFYAFSRSRDYPDPSYPFATAFYLKYLAGNWVVIGAVVGVLVFLIMCAEDVFAYYDRTYEQRLGKRVEKKRDRK